MEEIESLWMEKEPTNSFFFIIATCAVTSIFKKRGAHVLTLRCGNPPLTIPLYLLSFTFFFFFYISSWRWSKNYVFLRKTLTQRWRTQEMVFQKVTTQLNSMKRWSDVIIVFSPYLKRQQHMKKFGQLI